MSRIVSSLVGKRERVVKKKGNPIRLPLPPPGLNQLGWLAKRFSVKLNTSTLESIRWWNPSRQLLDLRRKGFLPGTYGLFDSFVPAFIAMGSFQNRHKLKGVENVHEFISLTGKGKKKGVILPDHKAFADVFIVQVALALLGYWGIACRTLIPLIGSIYVECQPFESLILSASNRIVLIPPTIIKQRLPKESRTKGSRDKEARRLKVDEFGLAAEVALEERLEKGDTGLLFGEGTRSREAKMQPALSGITKLLDKPGYLILTVAIKGSEGMWPPTVKGFLIIPDLLHETTVTFGRPLPREEIRERALDLSENFAVSFEQAFADVIYWEIGQLHIRNGDRHYAGHYNHDRQEDMYTPRVKTLAAANEG